MPPKDVQALPFVTRKMLDFEFATKLELVVELTSFSTSPVFVVGATKAGTFKFLCTPTNDGAITTFRFGLGDVPIWVSGIDIEQNYSAGGTFMRITLAVNRDMLFALVSGYVSFNHPITYPTGATEAPGPNRVRTGSDSSSNPAAGVELSISVPSNALWRFRAANFTLVTDANAATRTVSVRMTTGNGVIYEFISPVTQTASLTRNYRVQPVGAGLATSVGTEIIIPVPDEIWLDNGSTITTVTNNKQAGDDFGAMTVQRDLYFQD